MNRLQKFNKAFTLLEVVITVFLLSVLVVGVVVLINPPRQFAKSRNFVRLSDITAINKALNQYALEHNGQYPTGLTYQLKEICKEGVSATQCASSNLVDLSVLSVNQKYLPRLPFDPLSINPYGTGYWIIKLSGRQVALEAPLSELGEFISTQDIGTCQAECANKACGSSDGCGGVCADNACVADLVNIAISGSPSNYSFASSVYDYPGLLTSSSISSVTITPTGTGVITVDGQSVLSDTASPPITLDFGLEQIIQVKVSDVGQASKTYTIKIKRSSLDFYGLGGIISYSGDYTIHTFKSSGIFSAIGQGRIDFLIVAGGGAGGFCSGGGGGAGGFIHVVNSSITSGDKIVTVGMGGTGNVFYGDGQNSNFLNYTAVGGGGGGPNYLVGRFGGSGGGSGYSNYGMSSSVIGQGSDGGMGNPLYNRGGGGGGGKQRGESSSSGGSGGKGIASYMTGQLVLYCGGGGGGSFKTTTPGVGGDGGGGNGGKGTKGFSATPNTGGGGGGGGVDGRTSFDGGDGGSGIVTIKYLTPK